MLGRDLGLSMRMGMALLLLALLYFPLPIAFVMVILGLTGSWLLAVGALAAVSVPLCYLPALSERITLASAQASDIAAADEPELRALVGRLATTADLPVPRLAVAPTDVPNAFAAGRSPRDAVLVVTRGLLSRLSAEELEAVLPHELTHVASHDAFVMTLVGAPAMLGKRVSFWLGGDPFKAALPVAAAWMAGVVLGVRGAGRASAGASGMGFAVGALALLVGPWLFAIVGFFVVFLLGSAGVGPF